MFITGVVVASGDVSIWSRYSFTHVQSALQDFATHCLLLSNQPLKEKMILCFYSLEKSEMFLNLETLQTCCQVKHFDY